MGQCASGAPCGRTNLRRLARRPRARMRTTRPSTSVRVHTFKARVCSAGVSKRHRHPALHTSSSICDIYPTHRGRSLTLTIARCSGPRPGGAHCTGLSRRATARSQGARHCTCSETHGIDSGTLRRAMREPDPSSVIANLGYRTGTHVRHVTAQSAVTT